MAPPSVLVLGSGELGTAVVAGLAAHPGRQGARLGVLLRGATIASTEPAKAASVAHLRALGVDELVAGDVVQDPVEELAATLGRADFDVVICCVGYGVPAGTQTRVTEAVLRAARARREAGEGKGEGEGEGKGALRYFPWQFGMDYDAVGAGSSQDLFDEQLAVREMLRAQQDKEDDEVVRWTIVSTGLFMSYLFLEAFGVVDLRGRTVRALGGWDQEMTFTVPADIGRLVAECVYAPPDAGRSGVVYVAGDTVSYARVADLVEARFGGAWRRELWDRQTLRRQLEEKPGDVMAKYRGTFGEGRGVAWPLDRTLNAQRGIKVTNVEEYLRGMEDLE